MGWQVGYVDRRWVGYGVPATCDHPHCDAEIDRGLSYRCGDLVVGDEGCGLFFCGAHLYVAPQRCCQCDQGLDPFDPSPDTAEWIDHMLTDESWADWRADNPDEVRTMQNQRWITANEPYDQKATR